MTTHLQRASLAATLVVAAAANGVHAAINDDGGGSPFTGTGAGELFLHAVSFADNKAIVIDSGITAATFRANPTAGWSFGANPVFADFIATATPGSVIYNIGAVHNGDFASTLDPSVWGVLASSASPIGVDPAFLGFNALVASMGTHADHLINVNGLGGSASANLTKLITNPAAPDFWWGDSAGGLGLVNTADIGGALAMYYITLDLAVDDQGNAGKAMNLASGYAWKVNALTGAVDFAPVAAVPIPAAAWLFGSALLGLVGIARRRT